MWVLLLVGVFIFLGLAPRPVAHRSSALALLAIVAVVGFQAVRGHLL